MIYEIINIGKGVITTLTPSNLLLITPLAVTNTSQLINDGSDGLNPYLTVAPIPNIQQVLNVGNSTIDSQLIMSNPVGRYSRTDAYGLTTGSPDWWAIAEGLYSSFEGGSIQTTNGSSGVDKITTINMIRFTAGNILFNYPEKVAGTYTLATLDDLTGGGVIDILYANLAIEITNSTLVVGQKYRIIDYSTVHTITNTLSVNYGPLEPLTVIALKNNELEPIAFSENFPDDIIYYNYQNDQTVVPGCETGYIYRRIWTVNNIDIGMDWRTVVYRRWEINVTTIWDGGTFYQKNNIVKDPAGQGYYISLIGNNFNNALTLVDKWRRFEWNHLAKVSPVIGTWTIQDNINFTELKVPTSSQYTDYKIFGTTSNISLIRNFVIAPTNTSIIFYNNSVFFGNNLSNNTIGERPYNNTVDDNFSFNIIGANFVNNSIGQLCSANYIQSGFQNNSINNNFQTNQIDSGFTKNSIGGYFRYNRISSVFTYNLMGDYFNNNVVGMDCYGNLFSYNFNYNILANDFRSNSFSQACQRLNVEINKCWSVNFTGATIVYLNYGKTIFVNSANVLKMRYFDASDVLVVTLPTT